ncbi:nucleotidyl transferase AbiEii/AbiGii toxin family protein [Rhizobium ruizarguesonis]|uniref:nucleotidyl transferase AbiEii/AbiGii toxin family protein n=1 Tax=Rhizobium ruizarguesonis TaxID=2081791 RepID=UPI0013EE91B0|nr:nucleotidyl transferase AbiEii/AbiGii toxin family protein [Rhizobium ruizarguesonis]
MQDFKTLAEALGSSLKQTCRNKRMDIELAASRHVADRILCYWAAGFGGAVKMVKGGCMFDQHLRPTSDLDLATPIRWTEDELQKGFARIADALRAEGIAIEHIKIKELAVGEGDSVVRVVVQGKCGTLRGNTHVDITSASGPFAWPQDAQRQELPALLPKRFPGAVVHVQPLAAAAAEKRFAVLTQRDDDFRAKHAMDLLSFDAMGVSPHDIAVEMIRTARHRGIPLSLCQPTPKTLDWTSFLLRADSWVKIAAERRIDNFDAWQSYEMLNDYWPGRTKP